MTDTPTTADPLAALAALAVRLAVHGLRTELVEAGLRVSNPNAPGCCDDVRHPSDVITCRPHSAGSSQRWFFTSWGEALAPAHHLDDALALIRANLTPADDREQEAVT
ncbi:hypothetical protein [Actinomadura oligospora]|uniref:hypothetical protein n=1 Tax=Actinomadura oligospora TaxID=111804 RepID=UPI0004797E38|nr:hypothetical protein [Actinomadura oligospora]